MIDTTGFNTAAAAGQRLTYAVPWNDSDPATFMLLTRLKSGGPDRDSLGAGIRQKLLIVGTDTAAPQTSRVHIDLYNDGTGTIRLRSFLFYNGAVGIQFEASAIGLSDWAELEDKWLVYALQYRGHTTAHKAFVGYFVEGEGWRTYEFTAPSLTGPNTYAAPTYYGFGWQPSQNVNERQPYTDASLYYQFFDETWDKDTFDAVCESLISSDGTMHSLSAPINLALEQRTGSAACVFVGPTRRAKQANYTTQTYYGDTIANGATVGAVRKTTGLVDTTSVVNGTGNASLVDPADYGWQEDPEAVTPDVRVRGQQGAKLRQITTGTYTDQVVLGCIERSRSAAARGFWLNGRGGLEVPLGGGESLDGTQFPSGEVAVGSGFDSGFGYELWDDVVGVYSFMPQWGHSVNSGSRVSATMVDVAGTAGSYKTGAVLGSFEVGSHSIDKNAQRLGVWSNTSPSAVQVGMYATRLAPGQKARYWFVNGGGMTPGNAWAGSVFVGGMPGGPSVNLRAMSHGSTTSSATYPTGSGDPDWIGDAADYPTATTTRGTNDNPTVDLDGTAIVVPPADTTGDQPEIGDICLIKGDNLSGRMALSVFDSAPDGSGNATFEHEPDTNDNGSTAITNPTLTWGPYEVKRLDRAVQLGEPDAHGPFKGIEIENPAESDQDVYVFGAGVREAATPGVVITGFGQGGNTYTNMHAASFTTRDSTGLDPIEKLYAATDIDIAIVYPTYGAETDEADTVFARFAAANPDCQIIGGMGTRWPSTFITTGGSTDGWRDYIYDNAAGGAVDVSGAYSGVYAPLHAMNIDAEHYSSPAVIRSAELMLEQLATLDLEPETDNPGGVARQYRAWQMFQARKRRLLMEDEDGQ